MSSNPSLSFGMCESYREKFEMAPDSDGFLLEGNCLLEQGETRIGASLICTLLAVSALSEIGERDRPRDVDACCISSERRKTVSLQPRV
jgi:hypothetical protein